MITPSQLFNETKEVIEVVEETIEDDQTLEEDISHSVSLIDGAFRNIQEQILNSNKKELSSYKEQVIEVYNICNDIKENQLPRYKKEVLQSDLRTESRIRELKKELYETLEERIEETKETIKVFFREEVKELNKLRSSVIAVEEYIKKTPNTIFELREQIFAELRKSTEANEELIQQKLDKIGYEYEVLQEGLLNEPPSTKTDDPLTPLDQNFVTFEQLQQHYKVFVNRVQQQMATVGGGGEVRLEFLDDIDRSTALIDGRVLQYDASAGIWTGGIGGGGGSSFSGDYNDLTNRPTLFSGSYTDLSNLPTTVSSFTNDAGYITTSFVNTNQLVNGAGFITNVVSGVLTATSFSGDGSGLTGINAGIGTQGSVNTSGVVTATSFHGDGSALTGLSTFSGNYNDLTNTPIGIVTAVGVGTSELLQYNGSEYVGIASTGFRDYVINQGQGYYAYTTDFYTVGVANTTQEVLEGVWTLLQPQVAATGLYNHQPTCMNDANSGDPYVGSGATIGTGQTEFSLAGTKPGTMCLVRTLIRFEPDTDETDLDLRLKFTTNATTQGTGLTNFYTEKQALVMTTGAGVTYSSEEIISFFVGDTLFGNTKSDAGKFCIEANATTDGTLEIQGVTVMVDI